MGEEERREGGRKEGREGVFVQYSTMLCCYKWAGGLACTESLPS